MQLDRRATCAGEAVDGSPIFCGQGLARVSARRNIVRGTIDKFTDAGGLSGYSLWEAGGERG